MKFKRIQNRPLRMFVFFLLLPLILWQTIHVDADDFVNFFKTAWRQ